MFFHFIENQLIHYTNTISLSIIYYVITKYQIFLIIIFIQRLVKMNICNDTFHKIINLKAYYVPPVSRVHPLIK